MIFLSGYIVLLSASEEFSQQNLLLSIDKRVDQQKISHQCGNPKKESEPLSNAEFCGPTSIARETMTLFYLKPRQFNLLFNGPPRLIIQGPAGTGKTIIILLKILYLVKNESPFNIVLIVPYPSNIRCKMFLKENNINVRMEDSFPIKPSSISDRNQISQPIVRIVNLKDFSNYCCDERDSDRMESLQEHVFVDDLQAIHGSTEEETIKRLKELCDTHHDDAHIYIAYDPV